MSKGSPWTCPYCNRACTLQSDNIRIIRDDVYVSQYYGHYAGQFKILVCPNPACQKLTISAAIHELNASSRELGMQRYHWSLTPESKAKPFPDYIPEQLRADYTEACLIVEKSPKASATLSRRCLQGIIRDFWKITKHRLIDEISALEGLVDPTTWEAIDSVRTVGNIGAHMEKDVNIIIDVEPQEAELLIWLIETLFEEWYIKRKEREDKMQSIIAMAKGKQGDKSKSPA